MSCAQVMDVPNKWSLDEFLEPAKAVIKRYNLSRTDHLKTTADNESILAHVQLYVSRKQPRVAESLRPNFQIPLGRAPRDQVLEAIAADLYSSRAHLCHAHACWPRVYQ